MISPPHVDATRPPAGTGVPRVRRGAEAAATRTRGRRGAAEPVVVGRAGGVARPARPARRMRRTRASVRCGEVLDLVRAIARRAPAEREQHGEHGEDRQRVGVQPRREQRPAAVGEALGVVLERGTRARSRRTRASQSRGEAGAAGAAAARRCPRRRAGARPPPAVACAQSARRRAPRASSAPSAFTPRARTGSTTCRRRERLDVERAVEPDDDAPGRPAPSAARAARTRPPLPTADATLTSVDHNSRRPASPSGPAATAPLSAIAAHSVRVNPPVPHRERLREPALEASATCLRECPTVHRCQSRPSRPARMDVERRREELSCAAPFPDVVVSARPSSAGGSRRLRPLLRAPRPDLRPRAAEARGQPRLDLGRPRRLALRATPAGRGAAQHQAPRPGLHAFCEGAQASPTELGARRALAEARHRQPDPLLQGPRASRSPRVKAARARPPDARLLVDWQPRERRRGARGGRRARRRRSSARPTSSPRSLIGPPSTAP